MADDTGKAISELYSRLEVVEDEVARLRDGQDDIRRELKDSALGSVNMTKDLEFIKNALGDMARKKVRSVDVLIAVVVLIFAGVSAYSAVQNNHLTQLMLEISKQIP
jgi:hypothetical protein